MIVLYITAQLRAPWVHSLKEKRALLRPLMHQLRTHHNLAVAESGQQDVHTLMELTLAQLPSMPRRPNPSSKRYMMMW